MHLLPAITKTRHSDLSAFIDKIFCMDALDFLRTLPNSSVDMGLTSPPYDNTAQHPNKKAKISRKTAPISNFAAKQGSTQATHQQNAVTPLSEQNRIPEFLATHFNSIDDLMAGLVDGRVTSVVRGLQASNETQAIRHYWQLIDDLVAAGYDVGQYKYRMVSWSNPDA